MMTMKKIKSLNEQIAEAVGRKLPDLLLRRMDFVVGPVVDKVFKKYVEDHRKEVEAMVAREIKKCLPRMVKDLVSNMRLID